MLSRGIAGLFTSLFVVAFSALGAGCSSSDAADDADSSEGALTEPKAFDFRYDSARERAGEVELQNAYWAARFASLAYDVDTEAQIKAALDPLGVGAVEVLAFHAKDTKQVLTTRDATGTDGFYIRTPQAGFLAFRGTEDHKLGDIVADIRFVQIKGGPIANNAGDGHVHAGFYNALHAVWDDVRPKLKERHGDGKLPLYIVGHSLGGGLSTVAAHHLLFDGCLNNALRQVDVLSLCEKDYIPVRAVYTFGSPRVGDEDFMTRLSKRVAQTGTRFFRFVNEGDQVSMLPRYSPLPLAPAYRHIGENGDERANAILLGHDSGMFPKPSGRCADNDKLAQCDASIAELAASTANGKPPWRCEHSLDLYVEKLRALVTNTAPELDAIRRRIDAPETPTP